MPTNSPGRHRAPSRLSFKPAARASMVAAASTGLLFAMSGTSQATPTGAEPTSSPVAASGLATTGGAFTATPSATLPTTPSSFSTVRWGARGGSVNTIQRIVGTEVDGIFGPKTHAAVKRWQGRNGLVQDGIVGPRTSAAMDLSSSSSGDRSSSSASRSSSRSSSGVLGYAAQYTGIMYSYGGSTPAGFDCSGYTSYVFGKAGISLPRSAAAQQAATTPVSNPQPGDLVFFGSPAYHVGIYAGNGQMYDSGKPGIPSQLRDVFSGVSGYGRVG
ncbi:MAG TPA: NlpC/P60 family protein [Ornithinimicrobium sp.]|uniref:C40 family peptidase n=1 Tax=Ornithinimicrobium sp. TaxID=1977084 RepID=UPI002B490DFD|nr:NlpC/P60 family protein [Ornithinimicrobium sp.]HKJ12711.1 NlpC/P60 family protein [Ornithinimicrobium sp.]